MRVLAVNAGSTSLKLERYDFDDSVPSIADPPPAAFAAQPAPEAWDEALALCVSASPDIVAHRIVRMPDVADAVTRIDAAFLRRIDEVAADAPLHDSGAMRAIATVERLAPGIPQFAVSDSAFHLTMPEAATTYALPIALTRSGLRRIGFHGLSHEYASRRACELAGLDPHRARVVTAHLGGGSSLCAIRDGTSRDTTMGYTPLEGVPMATRSGSLDPGIVLHLLRQGMSVDALERMLERESGLLGMSGRSGDVRELIAAPENASARVALDVLAWRLRSAFGAMIAILGGVDLIAFTGGIGENAASIRAAALDGGLGVGALVDDALNAEVGEGRVESRASSVAVVVVAAREGWQLARAAFAESLSFTNECSGPRVPK